MLASYLRKRKAQSPKSARPHAFLRSLAVCVFAPAIPSKSPPGVALSVLPEQVSHYVYPISGAKVQQKFDTRKKIG